MEFAKLLAYTDGRALEHMLRALDNDLATVANAMAGATDLRQIGTLQGRYQLLHELRAVVAAKLKT